MVNVKGEEMVAHGDVVTIKLFDLTYTLVFIGFSERFYSRTIETIREVCRGEKGGEREREREMD